MKQSLMIDFFNGSLSAYNVASQVAQNIVNTLNPAQEVSALTSSIARILNVVGDGVTGNVGIGTIGSYIGQLAVDIYSLLPAARYADVVSILWDVSNLL